MREPTSYDQTKSAKIITSTSLSYNSKPVGDYFSHKDVVQQFCEKHLDKIKAYIRNVSQTLPMPVDDIITSNQFQYYMNTLRNQKFFMRKVKNKKFCFLNFACECKGEFCLYDRSYFETLTFHPSLWIHLIFLSIQVQFY